MMSASLREALQTPLFDLFDQAEQLAASAEATLLPGYRQSVAALTQAAAQQRMKGLYYAGMLLDDGLARAAARRRPLSDEERIALAGWPALVMTEVIAPSAEGEPAGWELLHGLRRYAWYPELPESFWGVIEGRLREDVLRLADEQQQPLPAGDVPDTDWAALPLGEELIGIEDAIAGLEAEAEGEEVALEEPAAAAPPDAPAEPAPAPADTGPVLVTAEELGAVAEALETLRDDALALAGPGLAAADSAMLLERYEEQLGHIVDAAQVIGLAGFQQVLELAWVNVVALRQNGAALTGEHTACLAAWPLAAVAYLAAPTEAATALALARQAGSGAWPAPAAADEQAAWAAAMGRVSVVRARASSERPQQALPEHVDLSVPADIDRNVLDSLLAELPGHTLAFSALAQRLAAAGTLDDLEQARRVAHTIKGAANTVGVAGVARLTHVLEDILSAFGQEQRLPDPALAGTLVEAADALEGMTEALLGGQPAPPDALDVYQALLDWANRIDQDGLPQAEVIGEGEAAGSAETSPAASPLKLSLPPMAPFVPQTFVAQPAAPVAEEEEAEVMLRVPASLIDTLLKLAGETAILSSQIQDRVGQMGKDLTLLRGGTRQFGQLSHDLEQLVDVRGGALLSGRRGELDALEMDQYNELHMLSRRIVESGADSREFTRGFEREVAGLRDLMAEKERVQLELQRKILRTRMVEVASVVPRLQRTVRQAARMLGRAAALQVHGEHTLVDTQLLQRVLDPLMHMLRNAVDHGIENADEREAAGKPAEGRIELHFSAEGSTLRVRCQDDGRGLDLDAIRTRAIAAGLLPEGRELADDELMRLILLPGFSTRQEATLVSGRGIGMDVVQRAVVELRGALDMQAEPGAGTRFDMAFPVRLSATQVMVTRSPRHVLALSVRGVEQILPTASELQAQPDGSLRFMLQGEALPALRLESLLGLPAQALRHSGSSEAVMVVRDERRQRVALVVPELMDSRNVVVKPYHPVVPQQLGVDGATILGDGAVAAVLDLPDLLRGHRLAGTTAQGEAIEAPAQPELPLCLVVDDSVSVRRSMETLMQDAGFEVVSARDGVDGLGQLQRRIPDVVLVDLEMPRMNGLEFTAALRGREPTCNTPVVMITSRFTDKHRQLALAAGVDAFLTKPYSEEQLLGTVSTLMQRATMAA